MADAADVPVEKYRFRVRTASGEEVISEVMAIGQQKISVLLTDDSGNLFAERSVELRAGTLVQKGKTDKEGHFEGSVPSKYTFVTVCVMTDDGAVEATIELQLTDEEVAPGLDDDE